MSGISLALQSRPRWTVRIFIYSRATGLGALYGPLIILMPLASVHCTDLQLFSCRWSRCTVRTFNYSHAAGLCTLYGHSIILMPLASVHFTDLQLFSCRWSRCTVQNFNFHAAGLGALYGPFIFLMPLASVQLTDVNELRVAANQNSPWSGQYLKFKLRRHRRNNIKKRKT